MGRLFALMTGLFPRLALFILWVARLTRIDAAFDTFLLPLLGIIFLPFVTLMYVLLYIPGRAGPDGTGSGSSSPPSSTSGTGAPASPSETRGDAWPGGQPLVENAHGHPVHARAPYGQGHRSIRTSVRLASALPDVRQSGSPSSAEQDGPE
jgi:hypothetical protein